MPPYAVAAALRLAARLLAASVKLTSTNHAAAGEWQQARQLSHGIVGRAGMFGFATLSGRARELEHAIEQEADIETVNLLAKALTREMRLMEVRN